MLMESTQGISQEMFCFSNAMVLIYLWLSRETDTSIYQTSGAFFVLAEYKFISQDALYQCGSPAILVI